jgi:molybdopterin-guanine dinucleotide biosynthesis protein A
MTPPITAVACVILAGGKSSRMKQDKTLLPFGGFSTLCEYQYARMGELFSHVYISAKSGEKFPFAADFILDGEAGFAPTYALKKILETVRENAVFVMAVDMPFLREQTITALTGAYEEGDDAVIAKEAGTVHTLCGIYAKSILPLLDAAVREDKHKLQLILEAAHTRYVEIDDPRSFVNLNYPDEYEAARNA